MPAFRTRPLILVADDEAVIADTLTAILNLSGFEAKAVYSGEEAVKVAEELRPDVLLTDVAMGGITGIEAAVRISEFLSSCKVLLFSGQARTADLLGIERTKGHLFSILEKPVAPGVLIRHLKGLVAAA